MLSKREKQLIKEIVAENDYYPVNAYTFVIGGMSYAVTEKRGDCGRTDADLSARELVNGIMEFAVLQFGFLAPLIFQYWRIQSGPDVGRIVYALISKGIFAANKGDDIRDFECQRDIPTHLREIYDRMVCDCDATRGSDL